MTPRTLWLRLIVGIGGATAALALVEIPPPTGAAIAPAASICVGLGCGLTLFAGLAQQAPRLPRPGNAGRCLIRLPFIVVWAAVEETLWRWLVLGGIAATTGWPLALAVSSIGFAAAHSVGRTSQLVTGTTFGVAYLASGRLLTAVVAHATYNLVLAEALARARREPHPA